MSISKIIAVVALAGALAFMGCKESRSNTDKALQEVAESINKMCPMTLDRITRLDNCTTANGNLIYNYTLVGVTASDINIEQMAATLTPIIVNGIRTNPDMATLRDMDVTFCYRYRDSEGTYIWAIDVTPDMYR